MSFYAKNIPDFVLLGTCKTQAFAMDISSLLNALKPYQAELVAVSKTKTPEDIIALYNEGQRIFGENRAKELEEKHDKLPSDIQWHMIGHLQRNKVKSIAGFVSMIESVDSMRLMKEIDKEARKANRKVPVLLQFKIAEEETKYGFSIKELLSGFQSEPPSDYPHLQFAGVMGMASLTDDEEQIRREFKSLKKHFETLKELIFPSNDSFREISMGMSGDYTIALEEGSTMVRIGSLLFGPRE